MFAWVVNAQQIKVRSRERDSVLVRFDRIRAEHRGGKSFKRRYRSECLKLLTFAGSSGFWHLLAWELDTCSSHRSSKRGMRQSSVQHQWLPRRSEPLLPRLDPLPGEVEDDQDSVVAKKIAISTEREEEDQVVELTASCYISSFARSYHYQTWLSSIKCTN